MSDDGANVPDDVMREERALREQGIREASQTLERIARQAAKRENPSLAETDMDLGEVKVHLSLHQLGKARKTLKRAERTLEELEEDVLHLRRSIAMLHRLLVHKHISLEEAERILYKLREATAAAEIGDIRASTEEVEDLLEDMIGGNTSTLNPFLFRHFWMGVDTRAASRWRDGGLVGSHHQRRPNSYADVAAKATCSRGLDGEPTERGFAHHRPGWQHPSSL